MAKNLLADAREARDAGSIPGSGRSPEAGSSSTLGQNEIPCQQSLEGHSPWITESDTTELLSTHIQAHTLYTALKSDIFPT